jgi:hypothetical protein
MLGMSGKLRFARGMGHPRYVCCQEKEGIEESFGRVTGGPRLPSGVTGRTKQRIVSDGLDIDLQVVSQRLLRPSNNVESLTRRGEMIRCLVPAIAVRFPGGQAVAGVHGLLVKCDEPLIALA